MATLTRQAARRRLPVRRQAQGLCRSRGGRVCAFDGAAIVLMPIADAAHVVHGPIACAGNAWEGRGVHSTAGDFHRRGFTTDMTELDIVYGGEKRLGADRPRGRGCARSPQRCSSTRPA